MKKITINLSKSIGEDVEKYFDNILEILKSKELKKYIGEQCILELKKICSERLNSYDNETIDESYYVSCNQYEILDDSIYIFNDSTIDISTKNISESKKQNYPLKLSLSKIIEYGIGFTGASSPSPWAVEDDWQYDVNEHGSKGWYYIDESGNFHWTNGFEGKMVFQTLLETVKEKAGFWIKDYVNKEI